MTDFASTATEELAARALAELDRERLVADLQRLVRIPSPTGDERAAIECLAELCEEHGLPPDVHRHDLAALRAHPGYPGEEADRGELLGLEAIVPGGPRRLCLAGHVDVVGPGAAPWRHGAWSGALEDGLLHGRGALDMKAGVIAMIHAAAAVRAACGEADPPCEIVLLGLASEEDGGLGAFAALERDDRFDACVIPEPTDFRVVCAHGGALTFRGAITGVGAHAAFRLAGISAIDRYLPVHRALGAFERRMNRAVDHPLMAELALPYPLLVGRIEAGTWSSQVPDRLEFAGRVGVPVGIEPDEVRSELRAVIEQAAAPGPPVELHWVGGQFASASTPTDHPFVELVAASLGAELSENGPAPVAGISYGADMRLFTARGIPCVMAGPGDARLAHAVNERVAVGDVLRTARMLVRTIAGFGSADSMPPLPHRS